MRVAEEISNLQSDAQANHDHRLAFSILSNRSPGQFVGRFHDQFHRFGNVKLMKNSYQSQGESLQLWHAI
jgi:hypothetical protein